MKNDKARRLNEFRFSCKTGHGDILVTVCDMGIVSAVFHDELPDSSRPVFSPESNFEEIVNIYPSLCGETGKIVLAASKWFSGDRSGPPPPVYLNPTPFQARVWTAISLVPRGAAIAYGSLSVMIGDPGATRAVAAACASNPVAMVIPCHRIVTTAGIIGKYRWGSERKASILSEERAVLFPSMKEIVQL